MTRPTYIHTIRLLKERPPFSLEASIAYFSGKAGECSGGFFNGDLYLRVVEAKRNLNNQK